MKIITKIPPKTQMNIGDFPPSLNKMFASNWVQFERIIPCNSSTWEVKAKGLGVQSHIRLQSKFKASLVHIRHCLKVKWNEIKYWWGGSKDESICCTTLRTWVKFLNLTVEEENQFPRVAPLDVHTHTHSCTNDDNNTTKVYTLKRGKLVWFWRANTCPSAGVREHGQPLLCNSQAQKCRSRRIWVQPHQWRQRARTHLPPFLRHSSTSLPWIRMSLLFTRTKSCRGKWSRNCMGR